MCSSFKLILKVCVSNVLTLRQRAGRRAYLTAVLSWGGARERWGGARAQLGGSSGELGESSGGARREFGRGSAGAPAGVEALAPPRGSRRAAARPPRPPSPEHRPRFWLGLQCDGGGKADGAVRGRLGGGALRGGVSLAAVSLRL